VARSDGSRGAPQGGVTCQNPNSALTFPPWIRTGSRGYQRGGSNRESGPDPRMTASREAPR